MRVIAGTARGRPLRAPRTMETRPTADLVRGVIFSMLEAEAYKRGFEPDEDGAMAAALAWPRVLDLYAGTGALGIEALSRGARHAIFVEQDREAVAVIGANLSSTGLADRAEVHRASVAQGLRRVRGPIDVLFADPPYADTAGLLAVNEALANGDLLHPASAAVLEQPATAEPPPTLGPLHLARTRRHGRTQVTLYLGRPADSQRDE